MTTNKNTILDQARTRAQESALPYAGAVTPAEAWQLLDNDQSVVLVDVRTKAERDWVGVVKIIEQQHRAVQWNLYPEGKPNPAFAEELAASVPGKDTVILFLCRSGVRSRHAATRATELGYTQCYDILEGFEGNKDANGHRKTIEGWCQAGLPWTGA